MKIPATTQRGVALVNAIFLIVALAALGGYMVNLSGVEQSTTNRALINARTLIAARAGLEWGIHRAIAPPTAGAGECSSSATFGLTGNGLENIQVSVTCGTTTYGSGGSSVYIYQITSTARNSSSDSLDYAERKVEATLCRTASPGTDRC